MDTQKNPNVQPRSDARNECTLQPPGLLRGGDRRVRAWSLEGRGGRLPFSSRIWWDRTKETRPRHVEIAKSTNSDIGNFRKAEANKRLPQHPSIPEDRHSNPVLQRVPNHDRRSKTRAQHHSKSIVLLMRPRITAHDHPVGMYRNSAKLAGPD